MDIQWTQTWPNSLHQCLVVAAIQEEADFAHIPLLDAHLAAPPNLPEGWGETRKRLVLSMGKQQGLLLYLAKDASLEDWRKVAHQATKSAQEFGYAEVLWLTVPEGPALEALLEASLLTNYQFLPYRSKPKPFSVRAASLWGQPTKETQAAVSRGQQLAEATCVARDLVNEPVITLTATELGNRITHLGNTYGFETEVMGLAKIQSLQMGGLLAVTAGSEEPPSFSILHHKPEKPILDAPVVLVGKGVVFDTGGLSLKPTANSMDF
ncbi:MAG: peptidase M17, partial [Bacteroidota bacterium]